MTRPGHPRYSAEERLRGDFLDLMKAARDLAETWNNGNKTDVYLAIEAAAIKDGPVLALLTSSYLDDAVAIYLARALHQRGWEV